MLSSRINAHLQLHHVVFFTVLTCGRESEQLSTHTKNKMQRKIFCQKSFLLELVDWNGLEQVWTQMSHISRCIHCGKNFRIFRDAADQTLPVTEFSEIYNWKIKVSYLFQNIQLQVTFALLHLGKSGSFRHSVPLGYRVCHNKLGVVQ
jgi:hypothetical protein